MIPISLVLTNFICYRQAEVDFSGLHVACLAGENGAGKSALLDALTWALWGRARAKRDEELIYLGEDEMAVELTFELSGQVYRVIRRRTTGRRATTLLDFQIQDGERWRSLAEGGIRQTQEKIERILHLDYDTFVNSAFLRQGRADEFTIKTAAERKRVLGEILGLDRWSVYEERVKARQQALREEAELNERRLQEIEEELARLPAYEAEREAAQKAVTELSKVRQAAEEAYHKVETTRAELRHLEARRRELERHIGQAQRELVRLTEEREQHERRVQECEALLAQADEIEAGYQAYQQAIKREEALNAKLRQSVELDRRRSELENQLAEARRELETERGVLLQRLADLRQRLVDASILAEYDAVRAELVHLEQLAKSREAARADLNAIGQEQAELRARNETLRLEMEALQKRITMLTEASPEAGAAQCPLCRQPLSEEHRTRLLDECRAEGQAKAEQYRDNIQRVKELTERARALERQLAECDQLLNRVPGLRRQEAALAERIERGRQAATELEEIQSRLSAIEQCLASGDYGHAIRTELQAVLAEATALGYDIAAHEKVQQEIRQLQPYVERRMALQTARERIEEEQAALKRLAADERHWQEQLEQEHSNLNQVDQQIETLRSQLENAEVIEQEVHRARNEEAVARQRLGASEQRIEACKALAQQRVVRLKRREELNAALAIYDELRSAFGVKGVPAMIIEAVVPEIEAEANYLLARMTAGRMHVRFETQRETQAGEVRETLEIKIADELGERPYENYSGGEQFRVNFAIRVALSRLLARRAGAQLQTLVIDEGFGTQDAQGRERLIEAINAVQDDFARILVITHIEELKDAFPARIEVTKTTDGSQVSIG